MMACLPGVQTGPEPELPYTGIDPAKAFAANLYHTVNECFDDSEHFKLDGLSIFCSIKTNIIDFSTFKPYHCCKPSEHKSVEQYLSDILSSIIFAGPAGIGGFGTPPRILEFLNNDLLRATLRVMKPRVLFSVPVLVLGGSSYPERSNYVFYFGLGGANLDANDLILLPTFMTAILHGEPPIKTFSNISDDKIRGQNLSSYRTRDHLHV